MVSWRPAPTRRSRDALLELQGRVSGLRRQPFGQQRGRQTVVAVQPGQILDQVGRPFLDVEPVRRRRHDQHIAALRFDPELQRPQQARRLVRREIHSKDATDLRHLQFHDLRRRRRRVDVHDPAADHRPGVLTHQFRGPLRRRLHQFGMDAAAEARARFAGQVERLDGAADVEEIEVGRLQQHVGRGGGNFRLGAAHDAGQRHGAGVVGDDQHFRRQLAVHAVERFQRFAGAGGAHRDGRRLAAGAAAQHVVVEGVQRLAPFEHDVVGNIDDVGDRAHPGVGQPPLHPAGRGADLHLLEQHRGVARRQPGVFDEDADLSLDRLPCRLNDVRRELERLAGQRGDLAGHADQRQRPRQVRRDFQLQHHVAHEIDQRRADGGLVFQENNALVFLVDA